jgi:peptidase S41-like protein
MPMIKCWFNYLLSAVLLATAVLLPSPMARGALARSAVLEGNVGYLRVAQTDTNLSDEIQSALNTLAATNAIVGIVVDLRFAKGGDSDGLKAMEEVLEQQKIPLAILVNAQTGGAAATLAEDLREANAGLIFGGAAPNVQPDIAVSVSATQERDFLKTPYGVLGASETNEDDSSTNFLPYIDIDHTSEADLVREKKENDDADESDGPAPAPADEPSAPQVPFIRDPVLVHGVDFIKGVTALRLSKG